MPGRGAAPPKARELDPDDARTARDADRPASFSAQSNAMLGDDHAPRLPALAQPRTSRREGRRGAGHPHHDRVAQRAGIAAPFTGKRLGIRDPMSAIEGKGAQVERPIVMGNAPPSTMWPRTDPVSELVKQCQARIELIGAGTDGEHAEGGPRHA